MSDSAQPSGNPTNGLMSLIIAVFSTYVTAASVQWFIAVVSGCAAILASIMAGRYYYYATKKIK